MLIVIIFGNGNSGNQYMTAMSEVILPLLWLLKYGLSPREQVILCIFLAWQTSCARSAFPLHW